MLARVKQVIILGCGQIGATMAADLVRDGSGQLGVTVADVRPDALAQLATRLVPGSGCKTLVADLADPAELTRVCAPFDLVIGALPSSFGLQSLRAVIESGRPYVDIAFMADDPLVLDGLAREKGCIAVVDCGVAPGLSSIAAGHATTQLDPFTRLEVLVGGLPAVRTWPYQYKAGFAPADVIEEYVRPARMVEHGKVVVYPALSGIEPVDFDGVGTLEAFNTDGLRTLITTLDVPTMVEKTLRWPGHAELMRAFRDTGLFETTPIDVGGTRVVPREVAAALLFPRWTYAPGEADMTVLRVTASGLRGGVPVRMIWEMIDRYDPVTDQRSMSRTTAFPATIVARWLLAGRFTTPGVHPPEILGKTPGMLDHMLAELSARGVECRARVELE